MKCIFCGHEVTKVTNSRTQEEHTIIRRRRMCEACGNRFTTYERIDTIPIAVIKRNNSREQFDRDKLLAGIMKSCNKRPVSMQQMDTIVSDIENAILNSLDREFESQRIGEMVMERLKNIDEVAYVRFASVYRQFKDINTFMEELSKIIDEKKKS